MYSNSKENIARAIVVFVLTKNAAIYSFCLPPII